MDSFNHLLQTVKTGFNTPTEVQTRRDEQKAGLSPAEHRLLRLLPEKSSLLDIGCATGRAALALAKSGHTVTGIDVAEQLIAAAKTAAATQAVPVTYHVCDPLKLPFLDESFHAALLLKTYCYLPKRQNREAWLHQIARILKPNGWLFVVQYTLDGIYTDYDAIYEDTAQRFPELLAALEPGDGFSTHEPPVFIHYFLEADLRAELTAGPFNIVETFREETLWYGALQKG